MNIAEVTLIGTGGYGESILVNLGLKNWIIVDSCINPETKYPLALEYLKDNGISFEDVKLIVCTHWHDDHIKGISKVFEECINAKISFGKAHSPEKFLNYMSFDFQKGKIERHNSSTYEFAKCVEILTQRNIPIVSAVENKCLYRVDYNGFRNKVFSLSPSDFTLEAFDTEIASLITKYGETNKKWLIRSPNAKSVALYIKVGHHSIILGADLEVSSHELEGWGNVVNNNNVIEGRSSLFKIPHHGSVNGFSEEVWSELLTVNAVAKMTPWNRGSGLPQPEMIKKYLEMTSELYMVKEAESKKPKPRDKQLEKFMRKINPTIEEVKYKKGIIKCTIDIEDPDSNWKVDLIENATKLK